MVGSISTTKACMLCIGNEVLSGKVSDSNIQFLAKKLSQKGICLTEVRIIEDDIDEIVLALNSVKSTHDIIFTSGGIGPTHDDLTNEAVAISCGVALTRNNQIIECIKEKNGMSKFKGYAEKMFMIPEGAKPIITENNLFTGFAINHIFVLAGYPEVFCEGVVNVLKTFDANEIIISKSIDFAINEYVISDAILLAQKESDQIVIGSYPFVKAGSHGTEVVIRGRNKTEIERVAKFLEAKVLEDTNQKAE